MVGNSILISIGFQRVFRRWVSNSKLVSVAQNLKFKNIHKNLMFNNDNLLKLKDAKCWRHRRAVNKEKEMKNEEREICVFFEYEY